MSRLVQETLVLPDGTVAANLPIKFVAIRNNPSGITTGINVAVETDVNGFFEATLENGFFDVWIQRDRKVGKVYIQDGATVSLTDLLIENDVPESALIVEIRQIYSDILDISSDLDEILDVISQLDSAIVLRGDWDASSGSFPGGANTGDSYIVSTGGSVGGQDFNINDRVIALVDNASTTVYAANWIKADYTDQVLSVGGFIGEVTTAQLGIDALETDVDTLQTTVGTLETDVGNVEDGLSAVNVEIDNIENLVNSKPNDNLLNNGGFDIWQRGTFVESNTTYFADRWKGRTVVNNSGTFSSADLIMQQSPLGGNSGLLRTTTANTVRTEISQGVEMSKILIGKTVTFSLEFYVEGSYTEVAGSSLNLVYKADSSAAWDGTKISGVSFSTIALNSWVKLSGSFVVPTFTEFLGVAMRVSSTPISNPQTVIRYRKVKLEEGSAATPYQARPIGEELALCQRYYWELDSSNQIHAATVGATSFSTTVLAQIKLPQTMRITPAVTFSTINMSSTSIDNTGTGVDLVTIVGTATSTSSSRVNVLRSDSEFY